MGAATSGKDAGLITEINVTPLVDVVLVLLVLMMVTATAIASRVIPVELPAARTGQEANAKKPLVVGVDERGALFLGTERADDAAIRASARRVREADAAASAVLAADGRARHEHVVHALELLRAERIGKIAIVVKNAPAARAP